MKRSHGVLFLLLAILWSGSFIGIKITVEHLPPIFSAMLRVAMAQVCLTVIFLLRGQLLRCPLSVAWRLWLTGIFSQGLPFALLFYGETHVAPGLAAILNSTVSIWALIFNVILFRDFSQLTASKLMGLILGLLGVMVIFWPMLHHQQYYSSLLGAVAIMGMAISYAVGALLNQHIIIRKVKPPFSVMLWQQQWASVIFLLVISLCIEPVPHWSQLIDTQIVLAVLYLGLFSTALAWMIYYYLLREWDAVRASSVMYVVPLLTIVWDYLFFGFKPGITELFGVVTILLGVILIQFQKRTMMRKDK